MPDTNTRQQLILNGNWNVRLDKKNVGAAQGWFLAEIKPEYLCPIPGPIQALKELHDLFPSANTMQNSYNGNYWLERTVRMPHRMSGSRLLLHIGGVSPAAHLWINGKYAAFLDEPHVAHCIDITEQAGTAEVLRITFLISEQEPEMLGGFRSFGFDWSGLYRDIKLETVSPVYLQDIYVDNAVNPAEEGNTHVSAQIRNMNDYPVNATVSFTICDGKTELAHISTPVSISAHEIKSLEESLDISSLQAWNPDQPQLYRVDVSLYIDAQMVDCLCKTTGFRSFTAESGNLLLNGTPFMMRGVGHEYFSVSISPIIDKELIRRRFLCIKAHGFNFCRYHTHPPTEEELQIADEVGLLVSSEIALISNMSKVSPAEKCLDILEKQIYATKHHPSMGIYCLGNEGSQIMVNNYLEREKAVKGYQLIKKAAPRHLAIIAFGMQGELPELPNDLETPHLWSHDFLWAYDGLADIPWDVLDAALPENKPWVIHEFGKFGVWPDSEEAKLYDGYGYKPDFDEQSKLALEEIGLTAYTQQIIQNSRMLSSICNRQIIEQARRPECSSGYVIWTFFRRGAQNAGMVDDFAVKPDKDPNFYAKGCNAPIAIVIDRGFSGHTLTAGQSVSIGTYISDFGAERISNGVLRWQVEGLGDALRGEIEDIHTLYGKSSKVADIQFCLPYTEKASAFKLTVSLLVGERLIAQNNWDFWSFPITNEAFSGRIAYQLHDTELRLRFKNQYLGCVGLREIDSIIRGCRSWTGTDYDMTFLRFAPKLVVTDRYDETIKKCLDQGQTVLLLDSGCWPEHWYTKPSVPHLGDEDTARFFTSFRCGWDQGNLATLIHEHPLLSNFPCEDYCDLQFYAMTNGARTMRLEQVKEEVRGTNETVLIRSVAKIRPEPIVDAVVQDPNAVKELTIKKNRTICAQDRVFLAELTVGNGKLILSTLRCFDDPAGKYFLQNILKSFM